MFTKHPLFCAGLLLSATCAHASGLGVSAIGNGAGSLATSGMSSNFGAASGLASGLSTSGMNSSFGASGNATGSLATSGMSSNLGASGGLAGSLNGSVGTLNAALSGAGAINAALPFVAVDAQGAANAKLDIASQVSSTLNAGLATAAFANEGQLQAEIAAHLQSQIESTTQVNGAVYAEGDASVTVQSPIKTDLRGEAQATTNWAMETRTDVNSQVQGRVDAQMQAVADARSELRGEVQSQASVVGDVRGRIEPVERPQPELQVVSHGEFSSSFSAPPVNASAAGQAAAQGQVRNGSFSAQGQGSGQASGAIGL